MNYSKVKTRNDNLWREQRIYIVGISLVSFLAFGFAVAVTTLISLNNNFFVNLRTSFWTSSPYQATVGCCLTIIFLYWISGLIAVITPVRAHHLYWILKIVSWIPLCFVANWIVCLVLIFLYKKNSDLTTLKNKVFLKKANERLTIWNVGLLVVAILMVILALCGEYYFARRFTRGNYVWLLNFLFYAILPWTCSVAINITFYLMMSELNVKRKWWYFIFLMTCGIVSSLYVYQKISLSLTKFSFIDKKI